MPFPAYIAKSTETFHSALSMDQPYMGSISAGDMLFLAVWSYHASGPSGTSSINTPSGWTHLGGALWSDSGANPHGDFRVFYKVATGGEAGDVTITRVGGDAMHSQMYQYRPASTAFEDIQPNQGSSATMDFLALTLGGNGRTILAFYGCTGSNGGVARAIAGYTTRAYDFGGVGGAHGFGLNDKQDVGSDGAVTATGDVGGWATVHVSFSAAVGRNQIIN
jgi:hypothetical protein